MTQNKKQVLMCAPTYFSVDYEINPWMDTSDKVDHELAVQQWQYLYDIYTKSLGWEVFLIEPVQGLPDMVFTANGGLVINDKVALPHFRQADRQGETAYFAQWFMDNLGQPNPDNSSSNPAARAAGGDNYIFTKYNFEGDADARLWRNIIFMAYPWRTDKPSHKEISDFYDLQVVGLQLTDARFYHLDTALTIVNHDTIAIYPPAFTEESYKHMKNLVPNVIEATQEDAMAYGLNAMSDGQDKIVVPEGADNLIKTYSELGFTVYAAPITEYQKSGGGVKCLTLELQKLSESTQ